MWDLLRCRYNIHANLACSCGDAIWDARVEIENETNYDSSLTDLKAHKLHCEKLENQNDATERELLPEPPTHRLDSPILIDVDDD